VKSLLQIKIYLK